MSRYKAYPTYKDSGVENLGTIPGNWDVMQLRRAVLDCVNGIWGNEPENDGSDTIVIRVADFDRPKLSIVSDGFTYRKIDSKEKRSRSLARGDLLLEKSGGGEKTLVGQVVLFDKDFVAVTSNFVAKMTPGPGFSSSYLNYVFCRFYSSNINYCSIKQNTGIQNLDSASYLSEKFGFPPLREQERIADFLDHETANIDALIDKQQRLIELLKEKRQAVISHAVTKGLNPNAPMKDSGVEWLGEVPAHWAVGKCGFHVSILSGYAFQSSGFSDNDADTKLLRGINVGVNSLKWNEVVYWRRKPLDGLDAYEMQEGDIVIGMDRPLISEGIRVAKVKKSDLPCLLLQRVASIKAYDHLDTDYLLMLLSSDMFAAHFMPDTTGVSVPHISPDQIGSFVIPIPTVDEQKQIVLFVSSETLKVTELIVKAEEAIALMQERRTALISSAVTGKIDVRAWQAAV